MTAENSDKTATFDKTTNTITIKKDYDNQTGLDIWIWQDISDCNILRVKYNVLGNDGIGFHLLIDYENDNTNDAWQKITYCPSYLTEMVIPLKSGMQQINSIGFFCPNFVKDEKFIIESVTLEKVSNPVKTDIYASNKPPVIDEVTSGMIDDKISAWDYVKNLGAGFNYPVLASHGDGEQDYGMDYYLPWGYPKPTKEEIHFIKETGFNILRLQTSPEIHLLNESYTIDPRYIEAIKEVVDWAIEDGMYVVICGPFSEFLFRDPFRKKAEEDVHYSGINVSESYKNQSETLIKAIWTQYAAAFNNSYDEHLLFETLNEPVDNFHEHRVLPETTCSVCIEDFDILNEYNQLIVDTIRTSGGNNANRFIIIEGLGFANCKYITTNLFKLPEDKTKDRLIPTFHKYPMGGNEYSFRYTDRIKKSISEEFKTLDETYFSKHIPVCITEVGHPRVAPILESIESIKDFMAEVTNDTRSCAAFLWEDSGCFPNDGFRYYTRGKLEWEQPEYIDAFLYTAQGKAFTLSDDFIKANEVKVESILGKNLLNETHELKDWKNGFTINPNTFIRSVPTNYKFEFQIEKTGSTPILQLGFADRATDVYNDISKRNDVESTGAVKGNNFEVKSETITITVSEELSAAIEDSNGLWINGQDIIIKSVKVVE